MILFFTRTGGDDHSEHSDYSISTSGSVVPQLEQRQGALQPNTQYNKDMNTSHVSQGKILYSQTHSTTRTRTPHMYHKVRSSTAQHTAQQGHEHLTCITR